MKFLKGISLLLVLFIALSLSLSLYCLYVCVDLRSGFDISTSPLAPASEFLKKGL